MQPQHDSFSTQVLNQIAQRSGLDATELDLKIQFGKSGRIILGQLASGERRDEVTEDRANLILAALQSPLTEGVDLSAYAGKKPMLEIQNREAVIFRQERDGIISVNACCQEQTLSPFQEQSIWTTPESAIAPPLINPDELTTAEHPAIQIAQAAESLINPLGEPTVAATAMIGNYYLAAEDENLIISRDEAVLVQVASGEVYADAELAQTEAQRFQGWAKDPNGTWQMGKIPLEEMSYFMWQAHLEVSQSSDIWLPSPSETVVRSEEPHAIAVAKQTVQQIPEPTSRQFFQQLVDDLGKQAVIATQKLQQGLESDSFKTFQRHAMQAVQDTTAKAVESAGHRLERAGQWLASRPEAIREQRAARAAYELFEKGFARTQEKVYEHHGFNVTLQGRNLFIVSEAGTNNELLRFKAEKSLFGDPRFTILSKSEQGISREQYQAIDELRQDTVNVRGSLQAEVQHTEKSQVFAAAAQLVAEFNQTNDYQGKHYRIQVGQDSLTISAMDGRGVLYQQEGDQMISKLEHKDFGRFASAMKMFESQTKQPQPVPSTQIEIG